MLYRARLARAHANGFGCHGRAEVSQVGAAASGRPGVLAGIMPHRETKALKETQERKDAL